MTILGIDPGLSGALALLNGDELHVLDMPVAEVRGKRVIDAARLAHLVQRGFPYMPNHVVLEHVQGVQGSGATSAFNFSPPTVLNRLRLIANGEPNTSPCGEESDG